MKTDAFDRLDATDFDRDIDDPRLCVMRGCANEVEHPDDEVCRSCDEGAYALAVAGAASVAAERERAA